MATGGATHRTHGQPQARPFKAESLTGPYLHRTLPEVGHNVPQEAPEAFVRAVVDADHL